MQIGFRMNSVKLIEEATSRPHFSRRNSFLGYVRILQGILEGMQRNLLAQGICRTFFSVFRGPLHDRKMFFIKKVYHIPIKVVSFL